MGNVIIRLARIMSSGRVPSLLSWPSTSDLSGSHSTDSHPRPLPPRGGFSRQVPNHAVSDVQHTLHKRPRKTRHQRRLTTPSVININPRPTSSSPRTPRVSRSTRLYLRHLEEGDSCHTVTDHGVLLHVHRPCVPTPSQLLARIPIPRSIILSRNLPGRVWPTSAQH